MVLQHRRLEHGTGKAREGKRGKDRQNSRQHSLNPNPRSLNPSLNPRKDRHNRQHSLNPNP